MRARHVESGVPIQPELCAGEFDRPHMLQMGVVYELPFARERTSRLRRWCRDGR